MKQEKRNIALMWLIRVSGDKINKYIEEKHNFYIELDKLQVDKYDFLKSQVMPNSMYRAVIFP